MDLAKSVLRSGVKSRSFPCTFNASLDYWSTEGVLYFDRDELMYLISERIRENDLFDTVNMRTLNLEEKLHNQAYEAAFPDGDVDARNVDCWCDCESIKNYIRSWEILINKILDGEISESSIEDWMSYFSSVEMEWETIEEYMS